MYIFVGYIYIYNILGSQSTSIVIKQALIVPTKLRNNWVDCIPPGFQRRKSTNHWLIVSSGSFIRAFDSTFSFTVVVLSDFFPMSKKLFLTTPDRALGFFKPRRAKLLILMREKARTSRSVFLRRHDNINGSKINFDKTIRFK